MKFMIKAALLFAGIVGGLSYLSYNLTQPKNPQFMNEFEKTHIGMTENQIIDIMGKPDYSTSSTDVLWRVGGNLVKTTELAFSSDQGDSVKMEFYNNKLIFYDWTDSNTDLQGKCATAKEIYDPVKKSTYVSTTGNKDLSCKW